MEKRSEKKKKIQMRGEMRVERQFKVKGGFTQNSRHLFHYTELCKLVLQVEGAVVQSHSPVGLTWPGFQSWSRPPRVLLTLPSLCRGEGGEQSQAWSPPVNTQQLTWAGRLWIGSEKKSRRLLVFLSPELLCAIIKELLVHLHEELQSVVDEAVDGPGNTQNTFTSTSTGRCKFIFVLLISWNVLKWSFLYICKGLLASSRKIIKSCGEK